MSKMSNARLIAWLLAFTLLILALEFAWWYPVMYYQSSTSPEKKDEVLQYFSQKEILLQRGHSSSYSSCIYISIECILLYVDQFLSFVVSLVGLNTHTSWRPDFTRSVESFDCCSCEARENTREYPTRAQQLGFYYEFFTERNVRFGVAACPSHVSWSFTWRSASCRLAHNCSRGTYSCSLLYTSTFNSNHFTLSF